MIGVSRWPSRSHPANHEFERPSATHLIFFSTRLLSAGVMPSSMERTNWQRWSRGPGGEVGRIEPWQRHFVLA
jgi:hypothetical protein